MARDGLAELQRDNAHLRQRVAELEARLGELPREGGDAPVRELEEARAATAASGERFRVLAETAPVGVYLTDEKGGCTWANRRWLAMAGLTHEEALGQGWLRGIHPEDRGKILSSWKRMVESGGHWGLTYRFRTPEGAVTLVYGLASPIRDEAGKITGYVGTNTDLSELHAAQEKLETSEAKYRAAVETQADGFLLLDREGRVLEVNDAYLRRSGYARDELLGSTIGALEAAETREQIAVHVENVIRQGNDLFETRHRTKDGTVWPAEVDVSYWPIEGGRFFAFVRDLNRRKKAEMLLRTRHRLSELSAGSSLDAVLQEALDAAESFTGSRIAFFHFVDEDQAHLTLQAWSTNTLRTLCTAEGKGLHYPIGHAGVWVDCIRVGGPVIHNDYASLPHKKGLPPGHPPVSRELVVPVYEGEWVVAVMGVGNKSADYVAEDVEVVQQIASMVTDLAIRRRAEDQARRSERLLRQVAASVPGALYQFAQRPDGDFALPFLSERGGELLGRPLEELRDVSQLLDAVHPEDLPRLHAARERSAATLELWVQDFRIDHRRSGTTRWLQGRSAPYRDGEGGVVWTGVLLDVTEQKRAEDEVREKERRYRALLESTRTVPWEMDLASGRFTYMGPQAVGIFGFPRESWIDLHTWLERVHPEDREAARRTCAEATERGEDHAFEYRALRADGQVIWILDEVSVVSGSQGPERLLGFMRDITEAKTALLRLEASEGRYRNLFEGMLEGVSVREILTDSEGRPVDCRFLAVNPEFERLTGIPADQLVGKTSLEVFPRTEASWLEAYGRVALTGEPTQFEGYSPDLDKWFDVVAYQNEPGQLVSMLKDVTAERLARVERERLETWLQQAQKMEAIGTLAGGIAHDFNNILTPIMAHAEFALMQLPGESPAAGEISGILAAAERARDLVAQILSIARREEGDDRTPVNLAVLLHETVRFLRASIPTSIEVRAEVAGGCPPVWGAPTRLQQVLLNLCTNARDAMGEKGGTLTLALEPVPEGEVPEAASEGPWVRLRVQDTGPGISPAVRERLFEPYFTTKPKGKGTGLGLAVVQGIVSGLGGHLRVESGPGGGATFEVLLPGCQEREETAPVARRAVPRGNGERILVVDDEAPIRGILEKILVALGYRVSAFDGPEAALDAFRAEPGGFDLTLTDYTMPGMTGLDLAEELLRIRTDLPILLCTGFAESVTESTVVTLGLRGLVFKPYTVDKLGTVVSAALRAPAGEAG